MSLMRGRNKINYVTEYIEAFAIETMKNDAIPTKYGSFTAPKDDLITSQLNRFSAHTRNELAMLKDFIHKGDCIIDIGAHIGTFSIPFAQFVGDRGSVYSIEADESHYNYLLRNIKINELKDSITPIKAIVSDKPQNFKKVTDNSRNTGAMSFVPSESGDDFKVLLIDKWHQKELKGRKVDVIKIDIEGAELSAFRSCSELIQKYKPIVYFEVSKSGLSDFQTTPYDLEKFLKPLGYDFFRNIGPRNSNTDLYKIAKIESLSKEVGLYDCLALMPSSDRYPKKYFKGFPKWFWQSHTLFTTFRKRLLRKVLRALS